MSSILYMTRKQDDFDFDCSVLESLLVFSTGETEHRINVEKERILHALVEGVMGYVGKDDKLSMYDGVSANYERYLSGRFDSDKESLGKLSPRLRESFGRLFKVRYDSDYFGDTFPSTRAYLVLPEFIKLSMKSVISMPYAFVNRVVDGAGETFSDGELAQLKEIASHVAPVMDKETDYVKKNYLW